MTSSNSNSLFKVFESLIPYKLSYGIRTFDKTLTGDHFAEFQKKHPLSECEYRAVQKAVPRREIEYRTGRTIAKGLLGLDPLDTTTSLYQKPNGAPNWPQNIIGSISHSETTCIVAITDKQKLSGIGIDLEYGPVEIELQHLIIDSKVSALYPGTLSQGDALRAVFCCKEAVFKALEAQLTEIIDFLDVDIRYSNSIDGNVYDFTVQFTRTIDSLKSFNPELLCGRVYADKHFSLSVVVIHPEVRDHQNCS